MKLSNKQPIKIRNIGMNTFTISLNRKALKKRIVVLQTYLLLSTHQYSNT